MHRRKTSMMRFRQGFSEVSARSRQSYFEIQIKHKFKRKRKQKRKRGSLREGREVPPRRCPHPFRFCFRFRFNFRFFKFLFLYVYVLIFNRPVPSMGNSGQTRGQFQSCQLGHASSVLVVFLATSGRYWAIEY